MTYEDLTTLLDYHYWARDRLFVALDPLTPEQFTRTIDSSFSSIRDTLSHIMGAEDIWLERWCGGGPTGLPPAERIPDVATARAEWARLEAKVRGFVAELGADGIDRVIEYRMFKGGAGSSIFCHMLQHVVNHASYHRGQITTMLRQVGATPPDYMDIIVFYRERS